MKTYNLNKVIGVVEVPQDAYDIKIRQNSEQSDLWYTQDLSVPNVSNWIELPIGVWQFLSLSKDITEEIAKTIMPFVGRPWCAYKDYTSNKNWFQSALESFHSWELSEGMVSVNPYGEKPFNSDMYYPASMEIMGKINDEWQEAQQQVKNYCILIKTT